MRIRWTEPAAHDLEGICDYIKEHDGLAAARRVALQVYGGVGALAQFAHRGRPGRKPGTRNWCFKACPSWRSIASVRMSSKSIVSCTARRSGPRFLWNRQRSVTCQECVHTPGEIRSKTNRRPDLRGRPGPGRPGSPVRSTPRQGASGATRDAVDSGGRVRTVYRLVFEHLVEGSGKDPRIRPKRRKERSLPAATCSFYPSA